MRHGTPDRALNKRYGSIHAVRDFTPAARARNSGTARPQWCGEIHADAHARDGDEAHAAERSDSTAATSPNHPDALRRTLGYLPQDFGIYPHLSAIEFLEYIGALKGIPRRALRARIATLLEVLNLTHAGSRALGGFSGGMRQRVGIAQALLNDPRLLIVDEPTAGLDPEERVRLRTLLREMAGDRIIIFSTHICSDVESMATRVAIVNHGALLADGHPSELMQGRSSLEEAYLQIVAGARAA